MLPTHVPVLSNAVVSLRAFDDRDLELVRSAATDPLIPLITTVPTSGTRADGVAFIARQRDRLSDGEGYSFVITERGTGAGVGQIGLWVRDIRHGRADIGYWIGPQYRRRGYATHALSVLTSWALSLDEIKRLQLQVEPWNDGSWRAAEACGFEREGLLRSWQQVGDSRRDLYMYSRIAH